MTYFLRLLDAVKKDETLRGFVGEIHNNRPCPDIFSVDPKKFHDVPGAPFAYWVSDTIREAFKANEPFEADDRTVKQGLATADDFRFLRTWWESLDIEGRWFPFAKGGTHSPFYADVYMCVMWECDGNQIRNYSNIKTGKLYSRPQNVSYYFKAGAFQTLRSARLAPHLTPPGAVFGHNGFQAFSSTNNLLAIIAILNSLACEALFKMQLGRHGFSLYVPGTLQSTPIPFCDESAIVSLQNLSLRMWCLRRMLDTICETSHAFMLPEFLRYKLGAYDPQAINAEIKEIQNEIDELVFDLYCFSEADRATVMQSVMSEEVIEKTDDNDSESPIDNQDSLLSWCVGVVFGRFDWRLATGERELLPEPGPFDPLPTKSPGMLPDNESPFHSNDGVLVDDPGHSFDIVRIIEDSLVRIEIPAPENLRRWLQRDFFDYHLKQHSKSRRKAPIYWPLSTASGSYTLWIYYPRLTNQTLYTAVNDFIEPKLNEISGELTSLSAKGSQRNKSEDKLLEQLQDLEDELIEMRDAVLGIAKSYQPRHDDGVQITAAPLWPLFRHKAWQKVLKDTWKKLEKGDYDWAHLSMNYWPDRVREKCKKDKSLAIAHGLEELFED